MTSHRPLNHSTRESAVGNAQFDFNNSSQPLPWNAREGAYSPREGAYSTREKQHQPKLRVSSITTGLTTVDNVKVRRFTDCADAELLAYLAERCVSPDFLHEIDLFIRGHPELMQFTEGRDMLQQLSTLSPLRAYKYFLKGYTRPARCAPDIYYHNLCFAFAVNLAYTKADTLQVHRRDHRVGLF